MLKSGLDLLQRIGAALMMPVAVLPVAGLLLGLGASKFSFLPPVVSGLMAQSGGVIFTVLPLIFALAVALSFTDSDVVGGISAVITYVVMLAVMGVMAQQRGVSTQAHFGIPSIDTGVFGGVLAGAVAALLYNRYHRVELPSALAFFSGRRLVPVLCAGAGLLLGVSVAFVWPTLQGGIEQISHWAVVTSPRTASSVYAFVERLLIPFGLHHIWNVPFFFEMGAFTDASGKVVHGDISRFFAGDPTAGTLGGAYLFKMFGLPGAAIAMWQMSRPEHRLRVGGMMLSGALTSFLTGVTEPIEFAFLFAAPPLYLVHALLAALSQFVINSLDVHLGFTFSQGAIDLLAFNAFSPNAHGVAWVLGLGPIYGLAYYGIFRFAIRRWSLRTPGREGEVETVLPAGAQSTVASLPDDAIVVADELTPTQLAQLDATKLKGLVTTTGSATSHVSILARGMGVPSVVGVDESVLALAAGLEVLLDGTRGVLTRAPAVNDVEGRGRLSERLARQTVEREQERAAAFSVGQTRDGVRIEVLANIKGPSDAREAMAAGAEGVGLLRSEFLFFDRDDAPSEAEQAESYRAVAEAVGPRHALVVRTLDVGGDKPLPYLPLPKEGNPFLGLRGIRVSLDRPELFRAQLRAILSAAGLTQLHVMFPMISGLEELRAARAMLDEERAGKNLAVKVGIMVEVPSAVVLAEALAAEADFFSIGTNDLTQYALAMDRGHPQLARRADALHPAVLRMIGQTVDGARKHDRPVHVCGGIASDALAVPVLVGLGVTELSVSVPAVASVKATLAKWSLAECRALATEALEQTTTAAVRALLETRSPGRLRGISVIAAGA